MRHFHLVAVYLQDMAYGGPEEGGWYYETGQLVRVVRGFRNEKAAYTYCRRLNQRLKSREFGPNSGRREMSSVLGEGEYWAEVYADQAPRSYPDGRPRYE